MILILITFCSGAIGGAFNYYINKSERGSAGRGFLRHFLYGIVTAAIIPVLLVICSLSTLDTTAAHFVLFGSCVLTSIICSVLCQEIIIKLNSDDI